MDRRLPTATGLFLLAGLVTANGAGLPPLPPRLIALDTAGSDTPHFGMPDAPLQAPVTQLRLRFDAALAAVPLAAFRVVESGVDGAVATSACDALPGGDDVDVALTGTHWEPALQEATLQLAAADGLPRGRYRVLACDALLSLAGLALDGDEDGAPGGVALRDFEVHETPVLSNPGFDDETAPWEIYPSSIGHPTLQRVALDADGAPASGALRLTSDRAVRLESSQCIDLDALATSSTPRWQLRLRHRVVSGNVRITAIFSAGFPGDLGDAACIGPSVSQNVAFNAEATPGFATYSSDWLGFRPDLPNGALALLVVPRDDQPFDILFDDLGLRLDSRVIFHDDFD